MTRREAPPVIWSKDRQDEQIRFVSTAVRDLLAESTIYRVSLTADATETVVTAVGANPEKIASLTPLTADAAAEMGTTYAVVGTDRIVVHHAAGTTDRQFGIRVQG